MSFQFFEATLRHRGRDVDPGKVAPFLIGIDLDDQAQAVLADRKLYHELVAAVRRHGGEPARDLPEYEMQLRARGSRDVRATFASAWRDPAGERR